MPQQLLGPGGRLRYIGVRTAIIEGVEFVWVDSRVDHPKLRWPIFTTNLLLR